MEWKVIPSYPNYEASSDGQVRNKRNNRVLKQSTLMNGYIRVIIDSKTKLVHRLVAEAFYGSKKGVVHHKDNNKSNNNLCNLEWTTQSYNVKKAYLDGLCSSRTGINNPNYKKGLYTKQR